MPACLYLYALWWDGVALWFGLDPSFLDTVHRISDNILERDDMRLRPRFGDQRRTSIA